MPNVVFTKKPVRTSSISGSISREDDPTAADRVLDRLDDTASHLADHPEMGAARDDIRPGLRYLISGSYLLLYRITDAGVEIVRAAHGRRDLIGLF